MSTLDLQNNLIKNARGLVYKNEGGQRLFLLTQELDGGYTLPGGCKDLEDQDFLFALKRELKEELNLSVSDCTVRDTNIQKTYQKLYPDPTSERFGKETIIRLFFVECNASQQFNLSADIKSVQWLTESDVKKSLITNHMRELFMLGIKELH